MPIVLKVKNYSFAYTSRANLRLAHNRGFNRTSCQAVGSHNLSTAFECIQETYVLGTWKRILFSRENSGQRTTYRNLFDRFYGQRFEGPEAAQYFSPHRAWGYLILNIFILISYRVNITESIVLLRTFNFLRTFYVVRCIRTFAVCRPIVGQN